MKNLEAKASSGDAGGGSANGAERTANVARAADALADDRVAVLDGFLSRAETRALADEAREARRRGRFRRAGVGRGGSFHLDPETRADEVRWIDPSSATRLERRALGRMEDLRLALNERSFLGLFGFEAHFALYPPGAFYRPHVDRFAGARHRLVSSVLYLNEDWGADDGGALRIHPASPEDGSARDVAPLGGRLVLFQSEGTLHEVLPSERERWSIAGWFTERT